MEHKKLADPMKANNTSFKGEVVTTYDRLVELFGEPGRGGDKTQVEWEIEFEDGTIATIYDWKETIPPKDVTDWHIGGMNELASTLVARELGVRVVRW